MSFNFDDEINPAEIQAMFRTESLELLEEGEGALLELEKQPESRELVQTVFRCVHSIKGCAKVAGYDEIGEFTHGFEDLLDLVHKGQLSVTPQLVTFLLKFIDVLNDLIPATEKGTINLTSEQKQLIGHLEQWFPKDKRKVESENESSLEANADTANTVKTVDNEIPHAGVDGTDLKAKTIRVPTERLDQLMNLVGEIAIARGQVTDVLETNTNEKFDTISRNALETHREADLLYMDLQELTMKLRTVPIGPLFKEFSRPIRDLSLDCGKEVQLVIEGEDAEVDTSVVAHLRDPLMHMIRNAVYHGIEDPETRLKQGKSPKGTIVLAARRNAGSIAIRVSDDGAGLDRSKILKLARSKGLFDLDDDPDEQYLYSMIFEPGFSTSDETNEISGRGVGMDVVRRNAELLRGRITVDSKEGEGTSFTLTMPLTLAIIDGFRVGIGAETYVIPLESVRECIELPNIDKEAISKFGVTKLRDKPLPFLNLKRLFNMKTVSANRENLIVVSCNDKEAGIVVDQLFGEAQTVIKPLGKLFQNIQGMAGTSIMGNGKIAFVLDVEALVSMALSEADYVN